MDKMKYNPKVFRIFATLYTFGNFIGTSTARMTYDDTKNFDGKTVPLLNSYGDQHNPESIIGTAEIRVSKDLGKIVATLTLNAESADLYSELLAKGEKLRTGFLVHYKKDKSEPNGSRTLEGANISFVVLDQTSFGTVDYWGWMWEFKEEEE